MPNDFLTAHWHALTAPLLPDEAARTAELTRLAAAYDDSGRHYHTLTHVENLLRALTRHEQQDATVLGLAAWYHDAVYSALRSDNEEKSAEWALRFLAGTSLAAARTARVADLIRRTRDHNQPQPPADADLLLFLDVDLGILGTSETAYWDYARQVRREYCLVPDLLYRPGRRKVLAKLLEAPVLYHTPALREALDAPARRNLAVELAAWEQGGLPEPG